MLEDLRKSYGLTRSQLSQITGRSINYLLKAEQATFPSPPVALVDFYANPNPPSNTQLLTTWVPQDRSVLHSAYRDFQRRKRTAWLQDYAPITSTSTAGLPFRLKWLKREVAYDHDYRTTWDDLNSDSEGGAAVGAFDFEVQDWVLSKLNSYPTQYGVSVGLCLPAAAVYRNEKDLTHAGSIVTAMEDLVENVTNGEYAAINYGNPDCLEEIDSVLRIAKEEGVKLPNERSEAA